MDADRDINAIYSATYSNVPVFEFKCEGEHVMRRRYDDYINATHILKVADYDKPARTRILEREVQKGTHEKIQGGYGKYQGTWVPLKDGRLLAERNRVLDKLRPIFDYIPGDISPPQAPKHTTNSNKPKLPKAPTTKKAPKPKVTLSYNPMEDDYDNISAQLHDDDSRDNSTIDSASYMDGDDALGQYAPPSRKRKRGQQDAIDRQHLVFADALLDYFMLSATDQPHVHPMPPPTFPDTFEIDRPIDDQQHTALHWAAAMGDIGVVRTCLDRGANPGARNKRGETPLIHAVFFTNSYEQEVIGKLVNLLLNTIRDTDNFGATVLHHIVMSTNTHSRRKSARYYLDVVLNKLAEICQPRDFASFLNAQDGHGDTALHVAARHNAKKCIRALQGRGVRGDIPNRKHETADQQLQSQRAIRSDFISSSPAPGDYSMTNGHSMVKAPTSGSATHYHTQPARSFSQSFEPAIQEKGLQMSLALDSELRERDADLHESQQLLVKADKERHQVRQATFRHFAQDPADGDDGELHQLEAEYERLQAEAKSFSEQIQHRELHHAVRAEESALPAEAHHRKTNGIVHDDVELENQCRAGLELAAEQSKRRKLTASVVEAQASAGMSHTGEALKRLVSVTMGVPREDVMELVPELLEELEQSKMDVGGGMVAVT